MKPFIETAHAIKDELIAIRRALHQHPELSYEEKWTTAFIQEKLHKYQIPTQSCGGATGLVGLLKGDKDGPCIALRADIDALPIQEKTGLPFASAKDGVMHACGHDSHVAGLLGAAKMLAECRSELCGSIKFIFQPAEELLNGAEKMLQAGVLENPPVDFIFGMHNSPDTYSDSVLIKAGPVMAATASISITVHGKGGHGSQPHRTKDPVLAATAIVQALQSIVSRQVPPGEAVVVTIGSIHGGSAGNIIPDRVDMQGTVRTFSDELFDDLEKRMRLIINAVAEAYGTTADFTYHRVVPCVNNADVLVNWATKGPLAAVFGNNISGHTKMTGGEDFSRYLEHTPGLFCFFGTTPRGQTSTYGWHSPHYSVDEDALPFAAAAYAEIAVAALGSTFPLRTK